MEHDQPNSNLEQLKAFYIGLPVNAKDLNTNNLKFYDQIKKLYGESPMDDFLWKNQLRKRFPNANIEEKEFIPKNKFTSTDKRYRSYSPIFSPLKGMKPTSATGQSLEPQPFADKDYGSDEEERKKLEWEGADYAKGKFLENPLVKWANNKESPQNFLDTCKNKEGQIKLNCWEAVAARLSKYDPSIQQGLSNLFNTWEKNPDQRYEDREKEFYDFLGFNDPDQLDLVSYTDANNYPFQPGDVVSTKFRMNEFPENDQLENSPYANYGRLGGHFGAITKRKEDNPNWQFESLNDGNKMMDIPPQKSFKEYLDDSYSIGTGAEKYIPESNEYEKFNFLVSKKFRQPVLNYYTNRSNQHSQQKTMKQVSKPVTKHVIKKT